MDKITLSPQCVNGGEHHELAVSIDQNANLHLHIRAQCYGSHLTNMNFHMFAVEPEELQRFGEGLVEMAKEMKARLG